MALAWQCLRSLTIFFLKFGVEVFLGFPPLPHPSHFLLTLCGPSSLSSQPLGLPPAPPLPSLHSHFLGPERQTLDFTCSSPIAPSETSGPKPNSLSLLPNQLFLSVPSQRLLSLRPKRLIESLLGARHCLAAAMQHL